MKTDREPLIQNAELFPIFVKGEEVEGRKAVRGEDGFIYEIVSDQYQIVPHQEAMGWIEEAIETDSILTHYDKKVRTEDHGARLMTTYTFPDFTYEVSEGDIIHPRIEVFNSLDRSKIFKIAIGAFRLVCSNGMIVGEKFAQYQSRHLPKLDKDQAIEIVYTGIDQVKTQCQNWQAWTETVANPKLVAETIKVMDLNDKESTALSLEREVTSQMTLLAWHEALRTYNETILKGFTMWIFFNIITQYITHRINSISRQQNLHNRVQKILYDKR